MPVEYSSVTQLARDLGGVPALLRRELRPAIKAGGEEIADDMRGRASYSSRIPGAIKVGASFAQSGAGATIRVNGGAAPHASILEGDGNGGTFRHPVFGNRNNWVTQPHRPFFFPAVKEGRGKLSKHIEKAVQATMKGIG